jgi:hypothetical protein
MAMEKNHHPRNERHPSVHFERDDGSRFSSIHRFFERCHRKHEGSEVT